MLSIFGEAREFDYSMLTVRGGYTTTEKLMNISRYHSHLCSFVLFFLLSTPDGDVAVISGLSHSGRESKCERIRIRL